MADDTALPVQESRLAFFIQERLTPARQRFQELDGRPGLYRSFVSAELLESFLWLHHGVAIDYFPIAHSRVVAYESFHILLAAYYVVSQEEYFETWFTPPLRTILISEFKGRVGLFSSGQRLPKASMNSSTGA